MTDQEIKPCPFCGELPKLTRSNGFPVSGGGTLVSFLDVKHYYINCATVGCFISCCRSYDSEAEAIKVWNKRTNK